MIYNQGYETNYYDVEQQEVLFSKELFEEVVLIDYVIAFF